VRLQLIADDLDAEEFDGFARNVRRELHEAGLDTAALPGDTRLPRGAKGVVGGDVAQLLVEASVGASLHVALLQVIETVSKRYRSRAHIAVVSSDGHDSIDVGSLAPDERAAALDRCLIATDA
jgi:hypothetical protein